MSLTAGLAGRWSASVRPEAEALRLAVVYAAYRVPFGDAAVLAHAERTRKPEAVPVRIGGCLEHFGIELAITAISNGGVLEAAAVTAPGEVSTAAGAVRETRVTRGGENRRGH